VTTELPKELTVAFRKPEGHFPVAPTEFFWRINAALCMLHPEFFMMARGTQRKLLLRDPR
jgi:hypothetical protein